MTADECEADGGDGILRRIALTQIRAARRERRDIVARVQAPGWVWNETEWQRAAELNAIICELEALAR